MRIRDLFAAFFIGFGLSALGYGALERNIIEIISGLLLGGIGVLLLYTGERRTNAAS
jgi:ascorbate-specific PTS system EIIC-type component UlaA